MSRLSSQRLSLRALLLSVAFAGAWVSTQIDAHIVPPEDLHPAAESYRRASFLLERNPILWSEVRADVDVLADLYADLDPEGASAYRAEIDAAIPAPDAAQTSAQRKESARRIHVASTEATAEQLMLRLDLAIRSLADDRAAARELDEARGIWAAFEPTFRVVDPVAYRDLGRHWLEMSSSLGTPGVLGVGGTEADVEAFRIAADGVSDYLRTALLGRSDTDGEFDLRDLKLPRTHTSRLLPLPVHSPTYRVDVLPPQLLPPGHDINKQLPRPRQILNMAARGVDEAETPLIALGDMAFDSHEIFGEPARSMGITCNTCHNKGTINPGFIIPGVSSVHGGIDVSSNFFAPHANDGLFNPVDIPDLRGIRFTGPYGRDGRESSLRDFTRNVIVHEFNGPEPDPLMLDSLVAYMLQFDFLPNPYLEADGSLTEHATETVRRGEEIFRRPFEQMAGRSCSSCHVPEDHFLDRGRHDIGSKDGSDPYSRDRALETPTLLGATYTAPYFHDGRLPTLQSVVEWFDGEYELGLDEQEIADLTAYVEAVGEGVEAYEDTIYTLEAEMEEFSFFLATYDFLREKNKPELIGITFDTIAFEIGAHKWDLQDKRYMHVLDRLAEIMKDAQAANDRGDVEVVDSLVAEYRDLYEEHREVLR